jgi:hypothetical protein
MNGPHSKCLHWSYSLRIPGTGSDADAADLFHLVSPSIDPQPIKSLGRDARGRLL